MSIRAIVTDIEGTTSSLDFVHKVLFPYASQNMGAFILRNQDEPEVRRLLGDVRRESGEPAADVVRLAVVLQQWIREDRKATPLKALQGILWEKGFMDGEFKGHIYGDAVVALRQWHALGIRLYIYSSGSIRAQQLLFKYSEAGDLGGLFSGHFDTTSGHKREAASYANIIRDIGMAGQEILFLSDVVEELDACVQAGMQACQLVRYSGMKTGRHPTAIDFAGIEKVVKFT